MERHLLVTVSEQESSLCGIKFVDYFFSNRDDLRLTLYYTAPRSATTWAEEGGHDEHEWARKQDQRYETKGRESLESAKRILCQMGFRQEMIETKIGFRKRSKVMDIINEGQAGLYDALVLGRRGLSRFEEFFSQSTSKELLDVEVNFPIWFCRKPGEDRKNVLICLDGSTAAYRMVDHVGFILAPERKHEVTLLLVNEEGRHSDEEAMEIRTEAFAHLADNGFPMEQIRFQAVEASNVPKTILRKAQEESFAVVAVGRRKRQSGYCLGSVSTILFRELEGATLWTSY